jgi:hypothetical protein
MLENGQENVRQNSMSRLKDTAKTDLEETACGGMDFVHTARDRIQLQTVLSVVMDLREPQEAGNFVIGRSSVSF